MPTTKPDTKTAHTPGPWEYELGHDMKSGVRYWQVHNGQHAICCNQFCYAALGDDAVSEANAAIIVKAVNCHDELMAALKGLLEIRSGRTVKAAREAIAFAEGSAK